jgi:hypothetical protein
MTVINAKRLIVNYLKLKLGANPTSGSGTPKLTQQTPKLKTIAQG